MQAWRAGLVLGLVALIGCGGTVTQQGDPNGGSSGSGSSAGTGNHGGDAGSTSHGGDAGYGAVSGSSYGATGGDAGGWGGDISWGGTGGDLGGYGGDVSYGGDAGYAGTGGTTGGCGGYAAAMQALPVTFVYTTNTPVYVRETCGEDFTLSACDPSHPFAYEASCVADCSTTMDGCLACGACALNAQLVDSSSPVQRYWSGDIFKYGTLPSGCSCASSTPAPFGQYTVSVTTYLTPEDALNSRNGFVHTQTFSYPPPNGVVTVFVGFLPL